MLVARSKAKQNVAIFDPWSFVHLAAGLAAGLINTPRPIALGAAIGFELIEPTLSTDFFQVSGPETALNATADVLVFLAGLELGYRWNQTAP